MTFTKSAEVILGDWFGIVLNHDFQQRPHCAQFGGRQEVEQRVSLLAFLLRIESHNYFPDLGYESRKRGWNAPYYFCGGFTGRIC